MERALELLSMETEERMDCIQFGPTYYGTDKAHAAILYNNGPEPVSFVAILDEDAIAQEAVSSILFRSFFFSYFVSTMFILLVFGYLSSMNSIVI